MKRELLEQIHGRRPKSYLGGPILARLEILDEFKNLAGVDFPVNLIGRRDLFADVTKHPKEYQCHAVVERYAAQMKVDLQL